jgi:crotonobetainyl-CoA:carnitine CoA-transferase CaiB-like acyl-CoA transferase
VAGPTVTQMLAVMGAEVIKIESNVHTDLNRRMGPYPGGEAGDEMTGNFPRVNLSKKSCTLDLSQPPAAELAKELVRASDIVVSNFRNGLMESYGLGYDVLRELKSVRCWQLRAR